MSIATHLSYETVSSMGTDLFCVLIYPKANKFVQEINLGRQGQIGAGCLRSACRGC